MKWFTAITRHSDDLGGNLSVHLSRHPIAMGSEPSTTGLFNVENIGIRQLDAVLDAVAVVAGGHSERELDRPAGKLVFLKPDAHVGHDVRGAQLLHIRLRWTDNDGLGVDERAEMNRVRLCGSEDHSLVAQDVHIELRPAVDGGEEEDVLLEVLNLVSGLAERHQKPPERHHRLDDIWLLLREAKAIPLLGQGKLENLARGFIELNNAVGGMGTKTRRVSRR